MLVVLAAFAIGLGPAGFAQDPAGLARVVSTNLSSFLDRKSVV